MLPYHDYVKHYLQWQFIDPKKHSGLVDLAVQADEAVRMKEFKPSDGSFEKAVKLIQLGQDGRGHAIIGSLAELDRAIGGNINPWVYWSQGYCHGIAKAAIQSTDQPVSIEGSVRRFYRELCIIQ